MALVACLQMRSTTNVESNLAVVARLVEQSARAGAVFVATPENTSFLGAPAEKLRIAQPIDGSVNRELGEIARRHGVWLLVGSVPERYDDSQVYNTSLLFDNHGNRVAFYRKLHRFDIDLPDGTHFRESATVKAGNSVVVVPTPIGRLGLSICYDLRFPELYRALVDQGAEVLAIPSAFTVPTGRAHWHLLLRARAVETQCFVLAPAQEGPHGAGRHSFGHTLVADPWGEVLGEQAEGEGVVLAEVDLGRVAEVRRAMPVASHRQLPFAAKE